METTTTTDIKPFPRGVGKSQLWKQMQERMPDLLPLMNTLKDQGISSKVVYWHDESGRFSADEVQPTQLWQIDDALVERVNSSKRVTTVAPKKGKKK